MRLADRLTGLLDRRQGAWRQDARRQDRLLRGVLRRGDDAGAAVVEFVAASLLLLVPTVYLVVAAARLQAAAFAVEAAAREGARIVATADSAQEAETQVVTATRWALADRGIDAPPAEALSIACSAPGCIAPGGTVSVTVSVDVSLPGVPAVVDRAVPARVTVSATQVQVVDEYRGISYRGTSP